MGRLDGKVCFVTGAGSGIGAKTAELFAHEGASVIMADMHEENLSKVAADIQAAGGEVMTAVVNITDNDAVKAAFAAGVEKYGKIDALASDLSNAELLLESHDGIETTDFMFEYSSEGNVAAVKKGETELIEAVNEIIEEVNELGLYDQWKDEATELAKSLGLEVNE